MYSPNVLQTQMQRKFNANVYANAFVCHAKCIVNGTEIQEGSAMRMAKQRKKE